MRVGFITQLLWRRYGPFWLQLLEGVGAESVLAPAPAVERALADARLRPASAAAFRLAAAEAIALQEVDLIVAPELNPGVEGGRGGGQDPWVAAFPDTLVDTVSGLPPVVAVPAALDDDVDTVAIEILHRVATDPALIRRAWERNRSAARPGRTLSPRWQRLPDEHRTLGVVGQPWLMRDALVRAVAAAGDHLVAQHRLDPVELRVEGLRHDPRLIPTDSEVVGAARLLARRGAVDGLVVLVDRDSGADAWLLRRIEEVSHKPVRARFVQDLLPPDALLDALLAPP